MDRVWLLTWTTYGQWLPGDRRGFVGDTRTPGWDKIIHNAPGTPCDSDLPALAAYCRRVMTGPPILLTPEQAPPLVDQFHETAGYRGWSLLAAAVMANHAHVVVGVPGDPEPEPLLQSFKAYGSRRLNGLFGKPPNGTWWTESGSKRKLANVEGGIGYVERQAYALAVWS
ncbi:MAG: hypothetical protein ACRC7O_04855, partial [Fimbriiglobus sp.]